MADTQFTSSEKILADLREMARENESLRQQKLLSEMLAPAKAFTDKESSPAAVKKRLEACRNDFWKWDAIYFPKEMYDNWSAPGWFQKELVQIPFLRDKKAHIVAGPRDSAKTATYKKFLVWAFLYGHFRYIGVGSSTLDPAVSTVLDIREFLLNNPRIQHDFQLFWGEASTEKLYAKSAANPRGTYMDALSEDRSTRGKQRNFVLRYDLIYFTDLENTTVSMTRDSVMKRIDKLNEMRTSLSDRGVLIWEGNNFDERTAMNHLKNEQSRGILSENFQVHVYPAWDDSRPIPSIWPERYPAKSEAEMRRMLKPKDEYDWLGNYQQNPILHSGLIFLKEHYQEWQELPDDLRSVLWCDPNLSKKGAGDTTALLNYGWSQKTGYYYVTDVTVESFRSSNDLLDELLLLKHLQYQKGCRVISIGFDGNVSQESNWTNNVLNYARIRKVAFPHIEYRRFRVDDLAKNFQAVYASGRIRFPQGFSASASGQRALSQFFAFSGKKAGNLDDFPDALISAHELLSELGIGIAIRTNTEIQSFSRRKLNDRF